MKPSRSFRIALPLMLILAAPARADEVTDQLEAAARAYGQGDLRAAVETLNFAIAKIQEQMNARLMALLPPPLEGWQADPAQAQSGGMAAMITGTTISRRYARADGAEVNLNVMADSPLLPVMSMALSIPMVMQSTPGMETYLFKGHRGTFKHTEGSGEYEISLLIGSRLLIQVSGQGLADRKPLEAYLERLDLDAIQKALTD